DRALRLRVGHRLGGERGLAHAGLAREQHHPARTPDGGIDGRTQRADDQPPPDKHVCRHTPILARQARSVYIAGRPEHAVHAMPTIIVDDLDARMAEIAERGLEPTQRETYVNGVRKITYVDPDGNEMGFRRGPRLTGAGAASHPPAP